MEAVTETVSEIQPPAPVPELPVTLARLRQLYGLGLGAQVLPAALLGLPLGAGLHYPPALAGVLAAVAAGCTLLTLYLAQRQSREARPGQPDGRLSAALVLASAAGVPLLLASVLWRQAAALWLLLPLAGAACLLSWWLLGVWARAKEA